MIDVLLCLGKCLVPGCLSLPESSGSCCWGGLTFKVYMQEKLSPLKRIFFCISRVSAVLGCAPQKRGGGEEVSTFYRVSH